jgi:YD repeat-containing protein
MCTWLTLNDAVTGSFGPANNSSHAQVNDACGRRVDFENGANFIFGLGKLPSGVAISTLVFDIPYSGFCYGTWTWTFQFAETFTDNQVLQVNSSGTFNVVGPPPAPPTPATYGMPGAAPDGSGGCSPRYLVSAPAADRVRCAQIVADPVNIATGAATASVTDAQMPSLGEPFRFVRSYTSLDTSTGELGPGWTDTYGSSLSFGTGQVTLRAGSGAQTVFTQQGSTYQAPVWSRLTLTAVAGGYDVATVDQIHYLFDANGRLTGIQDRNHEGVTIAYDAQGRRSSVTDSAGRQVTFTYDPTSGLLTRVTLPDGRYVGYGYTGGLLTSVTDLAGNSYNYTYDSGQRLQWVCPILCVGVV